MLLEEIFSARLFRFNSGKDVLTPPCKISLLRVLAWAEGKRFLRGKSWREGRCLDRDVSCECWGFGISYGVPAEVFDGGDGFGTIFVNPGSSLENVGGSGDISDGVGMFMVNIPFAQRKFDGMGNGEGVRCVNGAKVDRGVELKSVGKVLGFNLFYEC